MPCILVLQVAIGHLQTMAPIRRQWPHAPIAKMKAAVVLLLSLTCALAKQLPAGCDTLVATSTDPRMQWFCQSPGQRPVPWETERDCTNLHIHCTPTTSNATSRQPQLQPQPQPQPQLVVFLPGTGLSPHDYSSIIGDFARHGFH